MAPVARRERRLVVLAGDGIGPEVTGETLRIVEWFNRRRDLRCAVDERPYGRAAYDRHGAVLPDQSLAALLAADAALFGAIGGAEYEGLPAEVRRQGGLLRIRRRLEVFTNLRPVVPLEALDDVSPVKSSVRHGVDLLIVRELTGGIYFGRPRGIETLEDGSRRGVDTQVYTSGEIRRVAEAAFELARSRRRRLCSVDKSNVMATGRLWRQEVSALHQESYTDVELSHLLADNCALQLVREPRQFDVLLADNLFGDLLSDEAAAHAGSLGMLPSASLGATDAGGRRPALYEPVHGSAPDIAGQGVANPVGSILSFALALRYTFERPDEAARLERAVALALTRGVRTPDIAPPRSTATPATTRELGSAVLQALDEEAAT